MLLYYAFFPFLLFIQVSFNFIISKIIPGHLILICIERDFTSAWCGYDGTVQHVKAQNWWVKYYFILLDLLFLSVSFVEKWKYWGTRKVIKVIIRHLFFPLVEWLWTVLLIFILVHDCIQAYEQMHACISECVDLKSWFSLNNKYAACSHRLLISQPFIFSEGCHATIKQIAATVFTILRSCFALCFSWRTKMLYGHNIYLSHLNNILL